MGFRGSSLCVSSRESQFRAHRRKLPVIQSQPDTEQGHTPQTTILNNSDRIGIDKFDDYSSVMFIENSFKKSLDKPMIRNPRRWTAFLLALATTGALSADDLTTLQSRLEQIEADNQQLREELAELQARESLLATPTSATLEQAAPAPAAKEDP